MYRMRMIVSITVRSIIIDTIIYDYYDYDDVDDDDDGRFDMTL